MAKKKRTKTSGGKRSKKTTTTKALAKKPPKKKATRAAKAGASSGNLSARRARGAKLDAKPQQRLSEAQQRKVARARGTTQEVADKYGVSVSTVKRLRRVHG